MSGNIIAVIGTVVLLALFATIGVPFLIVAYIFQGVHYGVLAFYEVMREILEDI